MNRIQSTRFVLLGAVIVLCSLPGVLLGRVVQGYSTIWVGVCAAVVGVVVVVALEFRPHVALNVKLLTITLCAAILSIVVVALRPGFGRGGLSSAIFDAMLHGWAELVTSPIPAFAEPRTLLPVSLVSYLTAVTSTLCVTRSKGPVLLLAPACAFLLAVVAAGQHPFGAVAAALVYVSFAGLILAIQAGRSRSPAESFTGGNQTLRSRRQNRLVNPLTLCGLGALTLGGALSVGPALTFGREKQPFDPRSYVQPPSLPASSNNPLELVAARRQGGEQALFTVRTKQTLYPQDLHLVALNHFDGATWTTTAPYKRGGAVLDGVARQTIASSQLDAEVTISDLDGPWLPSIGDPVSVSGVTFIVDPTSGSLIALQTVPKGAVYQLKSTRPEPQVEQLVLLPVGSSDEARDALIVPPDMPPLLTEMARTAIGDAQLPFQRAVELRNYLRSSFTLNNSAPSGFSYGHLERAFVTEGAATDEQFATMFATLGRVVGLPTRVVVGFTPTGPNSAGDIVVRGADARVWAEVLFEEVGWMPFTATPTEDGGGSSSIGFGGQDEVELRQTPDVPVPKPGPPPLVQTDKPVVEAQFDGSNRTLARLFAVSLILMMFSGVALASIALIKRRRTAQRRIGTPREAVIGAWRDVLERLNELGIGATSMMTVEEVVSATESSSEASSAVLAGLYRPVNRALYDGAEITEADRDQAWRARDRFVSSLNRKSSRRVRIIRAVNPRPLFANDQFIGARP